MAFIQHQTNHLVKSEDLNHHGTLFAGRSAEWLVESGFIAVAYELNPQNIVCLKVHGMEILHPVKGGHIINFTSQIVYTGRSSITVHVEARDCRDMNIKILEGFLTFCHVDQDTKAQPHGLNFVPQTPRQIELNLMAKELTKQKH